MEGEKNSVIHGRGANRRSINIKEREQEVVEMLTAI